MTTEIIRRARLERIAKGLYWDRALSLVEGCTCVSEGCANCWAASQTHTRSGQSNPKIQARYGGLTDEKGRWTGEVRLMWGDLEKPIKVRRPTVWAVWNDLFHGGVPDEFIEGAFDMMVKVPRHTFLVLTKRPDRMAQLLGGVHWWAGIVKEARSHTWLGTSIESQEHIWRAEQLVQVPAAVRYVSYEPALGPVDLDFCRDSLYGCPQKGWTGINPVPTRSFGIDWVIVGGESGPRARPMAVSWVRSIRDQVKAAGGSFFFKQWGDAFPGPICADTGLPLLDGQTWAEFPGQGSASGGEEKLNMAGELSYSSFQP